MRSPLHAFCRVAALVAAVLLGGPLLFGARVERDVPVPMRDGIILRADVYYPEGPGPFPVLLVRTPYGRKGPGAAEPYVKAGYIVVSQDVRGRYGSDGEFHSLMHPDIHDGEDGYDTIEWAARLPQSTGKVGTFGASYDAFLQWRAAAHQPPSLVAMAASSIPARLTDLEGPGTIRPGRRLKWWHGTMAPDLRRRAGLPGPHTKAEANALWEAGEKQFLWFLPWVDLPDEIFGNSLEAEANRAWLRNPHLDPWQLDQAASKITVPNICFIGWYDHCNGSIDIHNAVTERGGTPQARHHQRLVIGPWRHGGWKISKYGKVDFGSKAAIDIAAEQIRWFDFWLKGAQNGVEADAPVRIFTMGSNRWRDEKSWPVAHTREASLFLTSAGQANTPDGDGRLAGRSSSVQASDRFQYDPRDPVPSLWTAALQTVPADQRPLRHRRDILVYQTEPLAEALEVTGYPEVELYAASTAPDTDFFARLIDVAPNGLAIDVASGMVRARYRESLESPQLLTPGEPTRFRIRMGPTSVEFQKGHRIRLDVTSSDFPNYDRNHNTAADQNADAVLVTAEQTVFTGGETPTRLMLPVLSGGKAVTGRSGSALP